MVQRVATVAFEGIEAKAVDVQVHVLSGQIVFNIVGLPDKAVSEARERVRSALVASGLALPGKRITVNLAPADLPKEGSHFDLPIALGLMAAIGAIPPDALAGFVVLGELALDGRITPVAGVLPAAMAANALGLGIICPRSLRSGGRLGGRGCGGAGARQPRAARQPLSRDAGPVAAEAGNPRGGSRARGSQGHQGAGKCQACPRDRRRGGHALLMNGPPGSGKSMLASRMPSILPPLTPAELLEVSMIHSVAGELEGGQLTTRRPFRNPHHSASMAALVGGGLRVRPGEVSLAHHGVLFLDELPEFQPQVLDGLRQPLENGEAVIARANQRVSFPARFQLVAAMNPCRCGKATEPGFACPRMPNIRCMADYQAKISGPLIDRMDMVIEVPAVSAADLILPAPAEGSAEIGARVAAARARQIERYRGRGLPVGLNAHAPPAVLDDVAAPDAAGLALLRDAAEALRLTARGYHRVLKLARTIADLDACETVRRAHLAEAISYRGATDRVRAAA